MPPEPEEFMDDMGNIDWDEYYSELASYEEMRYSEHRDDQLTKDKK